MTAGLSFRERPAAGDPAGLLMLHHGRGSDERDVLGLGDALDPERRLHLVTPRAPLTLPGSPGYHWYRVPRVGYPDPDSFRAAFEALAALHDALAERTGIPPERTVLGGFSMGTVMLRARPPRRATAPRRDPRLLGLRARGRGRRPVPRRPRGPHRVRRG